MRPEYASTGRVELLGHAMDYASIKMVELLSNIKRQSLDGTGHVHRICIALYYTTS